MWNFKTYDANRIYSCLAAKCLIHSFSSCFLITSYRAVFLFKSRWFKCSTSSCINSSNIANETDWAILRNSFEVTEHNQNNSCSYDKHDEPVQHIHHTSGKYTLVFCVVFSSIVDVFFDLIFTILTWIWFATENSQLLSIAKKWSRLKEGGI